MKFGKSAIALAIGLTAMITQSALAGEQDFTLTNHTGVVIAKIMVSPHEQTAWGADIMGQDVLAEDGTVEIKFQPAEEAEHWDLKIVDKEGTEVVWQNLNLLKISKLTLKIEDGKAIAEAE